jgi:hypothetical protein
MARPTPPCDDDSFFSLPHVRWVVRVLGMLVAAVGRESLVGLILRQARSEIASIVRDEEPAPAPASCPENN